MFSGLFGGGGSAKRAANVAAQAQKNAGNQVWDQYLSMEDKYAPYVDAGTGALSTYQNLAGQLEAPTQEIYDISTTMDPIVQQIQSGDYTKSPGYDFRMQEGQSALESAASARGGLFSGNTGKALLEYGQDYGTNEYDKYINRLRNQLGDVQTQMGGRQSALANRYTQMNAQTPLIEAGLQSTSALGNFGQAASQERARYTAGAGATYASGMMEKARQMAAAGDQWLNLAAAAGGAYMGLPPGTIPEFDSAGAISNPYSGQQYQSTSGQQTQSGNVGSSIGNYLKNLFGGQQQQASPWINPDYVDVTPTGNSSMNTTGYSPQQQAQLRTGTIYA